MEQEKRILPLIINLIMGTVFAVGIKLLISVSLMTTAVVPKDWQADALSMTALFYVCLFVSVLIFIAVNLKGYSYVKEGKPDITFRTYMLMYVSVTVIPIVLSFLPISCSILSI